MVDTIPDSWTVTKHPCPVCRQPLYSTKTPKGSIAVWCADPNRICDSIGANEGGFGKTEAEAFHILTQKIGVK